MTLPHERAEFLSSCFQAGVRAVLPETRIPPAITTLGVLSGECAILALGKAAPGMAAALNYALTVSGVTIATRFIVGATPSDGALSGDHPLPGPASHQAAQALARWIHDLPPSLPVHVALSGGASSLIATPLPGISRETLHETFAVLLGSGLGIDAMNAIRKRLSRWSAGRLAAALAPRSIHVWAISDVPGDDPATIASGPCEGDRWRSRDVREVLTAAGLWEQLPLAVHNAIAIETMKPGDPLLATVTTQIVARNSDALHAIREFAGSRGAVVAPGVGSIHGEASDNGVRFAEWLLNHPQGSTEPLLHLAGGESVVTLGGSSAAGGRNQELALAAACRLDREPIGAEFSLLAAGTDGRDGTTDAAGAIVSGVTCHAIRVAGRDPERDLRHHESHLALAVAEALLETGSTGTNVMDVVIALRMA